jgi:hypothetical protein
MSKFYNQQIFITSEVEDFKDLGELFLIIP